MKQNYALALGSAFLLWLAWPPVPYSSPLLFVGFVPLLVAIENIIRGTYTRKGRKIFWISFFTGFLWNTASIYWVYNSMNAYLSGYVALLISLIPFGLAPLLMAAVFRLYYQMRKKTNLIFSFGGLLSFWVGYEFLHQWWDLAFPWMTLGNGFANFHQLVQWYSYTGVFGGTMWVWTINLLLFVLIWQKKEKINVYSNTGIGLTALSLLVIPISVSLLLYSNYEEHKNPSQIVVVQPNIDPYVKFGSMPPEAQLESLIQLSEKVAKPNTEFFIWPETAISAERGIDENEFRSYPAYERILQFLENYKNGNVLSGIESYQLYSDPKTPTAREVSAGVFWDPFNAAVLVDRSSKLQFYHKSKLVPGVEQLPFGRALSFMKPLFAHFGGSTGGYGSQPEPSVFYAQSGIGAAPVICYESIWGNYVAEYIKQGAQFIAVVTNDGWWGDTSGKDQHLQYAKLRAIENRRWVARSANTGISAFINQRGDIVQQTAWWEPTAITQEINLNEDLTFYTRYGDIILYLSLLGGVVSVYLMVGRKKTRKQDLISHI
ncbi:apolipoprotein N-acyltransferase [Sphingobacterium allocomposti]|uniref:Apolipoprotein N-acyltransferase n=1 Tax=Sphingobacterium allocomposti TaxID=415956 RepID=A0A5S5DM58_9SPHI|nr:apolipoprotein N-acyltransferase [Sphingobacterium composti Yoo et al. 2007 non Ten et al. 2007]TYP96126.1 apolipoprotein N-acyltransferase [Sphingobacterium composti Yoo et al. 2007 non Ten et al. 2007]